MTRTRLTVVAALIAPLALAASGCEEEQRREQEPGQRLDDDREARDDHHREAHDDHHQGLTASARTQLEEDYSDA